MTMDSVYLAARIGLAGRYTVCGFTLADLPSVLISAAPDRLELSFEVSAYGSPALELEFLFTTTFEGGQGSPAARAQRLKEYLVRADIAGHIDYQAHGPRAAESVHVANFGLVLPDDLALSSGHWFTMPLPLLDLATDALCHAQASSHSMTYRLELVPRRSDPGGARSLVPAVAALATRRSQAGLEYCLRDAIEILANGGWTAIEHIVPGPAGDPLSWLSPLAARRIQLAWPFMPEGLLMLQPTGAETIEKHSLAREIQTARALGYLDEVLVRLLPSLPAAPFVVPPTQEINDAGTYVFLSFAHADRTFAQQVISHLTQAGLKVWYDLGIQAGTAWDETLEQRIRGAGAVVACVSPNFEQSRWCTRELKFADLLGKTIVPISAQPWVWGTGMQLMFQALQICDFDQGRGIPAVLANLRSNAPLAFEV